MFRRKNLSQCKSAIDLLREPLRIDRVYLLDQSVHISPLRARLRDRFLKCLHFHFQRFTRHLIVCLPGFVLRIDLTFLLRGQIEIFKNISLPAGPGQLEAWLDANNQKAGAMFVEVLRRQPDRK